MPENNLDDLFTSDDRLLYTEIAFAQHVRGTLKWYEGETYAMARIERTIKRMTFAIVVKHDAEKKIDCLPVIRVYSAEEVEKMIDWKTSAQHRDEIRELLAKILDEGRIY